MITVAVPIFNTEQYLQRCVDSILNQTFREIEVILVDDGSTDRSGEICKIFEASDERVRYFRQDNKGVSAARNIGIDLAMGDYILFVDSDDWMEPNMIETLVSLMKDYRADIACCQYDHGRKTNEVFECSWNQDKMLREFLIHKRINGSLVNKLFRRELIGDTRLDESINYGEDALFLWQCIKKAETVVVSGQVLYHVSLHEDSASGGGSYKPIRKDCIKVWSAISHDAEAIDESYDILAKAQLGNMAFFTLYEMAYYDYDDSNTGLYCRQVLKKMIPFMKEADFISKSEIVLAYAFLLSNELGKALVRARKQLI